MKSVISEKSPFLGCNQEIEFLVADSAVFVEI